MWICAPNWISVASVHQNLLTKLCYLLVRNESFIFNLTSRVNCKWMHRFVTSFKTMQLQKHRWHVKSLQVGFNLLVWHVGVVDWFNCCWFFYYSNIWEVPIKSKTMHFSPCGEKITTCKPAAAVCVSEGSRFKNLAQGFNLIKSRVFFW